MKAPTTPPCTAVQSAGHRVADQFLAVGQAQGDLLAINAFQADALKTGLGNIPAHLFDGAGLVTLGQRWQCAPRPVGEKRKYGPNRGKVSIAGSESSEGK
jgi:hypothetical protein